MSGNVINHELAMAHAARMTNEGVALPGAFRLLLITLLHSAALKLGVGRFVLSLYFRVQLEGVGHSVFDLNFICWKSSYRGK